jgi:enoyl-CoA hydratase/carnithine racemase
LSISSGGNLLYLPVERETLFRVSLETATETARTLAAKPAAAVQASKRLMKGAFREQLEQAVNFENRVFAERVTSDEAKTAFRAFFAKRKPA